MMDMDDVRMVVSVLGRRMGHRSRVLLVDLVVEVDDLGRHDDTTVVDSRHIDVRYDNRFVLVLAVHFEYYGLVLASWK